MTEQDNKPVAPQEEKSFLRVIVHSFFIIPFLIAVGCVVLFAGIKLLTNEKRSVYDYLEDVKIGGKDKRWQGAFFLSKVQDNKRFRGAFELSKILSQPGGLPEDERFVNELLNAFKESRHDDNRVRQYLALAIGRTKNPVFSQALIDGLVDEKEENIPALIYAIGMLGIKENAPVLYPYVEHKEARVRSIAVVALGNLANPASMSFLKKGLKDSEPNVQWGSAISLAKMGDGSGKGILLKLLDRQYLSQFPEVDPNEANNLMIAAVEACELINDRDLKDQLIKLSTNDQNMKVRAAALGIIKN